MSEMLALMEGSEIYTTYGTYMVVGPNMTPPEANGIRTYRVIFQRNRTTTAHVLVETEALPCPYRNRPALIRPNTGMVRHNPAPPRERLLLNGNLRPERNSDNDIPLLNRLDLNSGNQNQTDKPDQPDQ